MVTIFGCTTIKPTQEELHQQQQYLEKLQQQLYLEELHPQGVLGTIVIGFLPAALASLPEPPIDLMLLIRPLAGGQQDQYVIADGTAIWELFLDVPSIAGASYQNFWLMIPPGDYYLEGIGVKSQSLSDKPFVLPTGGPSFTVSEGKCVYIGRIGVSFGRLAPGTLDQAKTGVGEMSATMGGKRLPMLYLPKGSLVFVAKSIDQPSEDERSPAADSSRQLQAYAQQRECAVQMAKWPAREHAQGEDPTSAQEIIKQLKAKLSIPESVQGDESLTIQEIIKQGDEITTERLAEYQNYDCEQIKAELAHAARRFENATIPRMIGRTIFMGGDIRYITAIHTLNEVAIEKSCEVSTIECSDYPQTCKAMRSLPRN